MQNTGDGDVELLRVIPLGVENVEIGRTAVAPVQLLDDGIRNDGIRMSVGASLWPLERTALAAWREREALAAFVLPPSEEADWTAVYEIRWVDGSREGRVTGVEVVYRRGGIEFSETIDAGVFSSPVGAESVCDVGSD